MKNIKSGCNLDWKMYAMQKNAFVNLFLSNHQISGYNTYVSIHDMSKFHPKTHCNINLNSTLSFVLDNLVPVNSSQVILSLASALSTCRSQYPGVPNPLFILKSDYMLH